MASDDMAMRGEMVGDTIVVGGVVIYFDCYCVRVGAPESDAGVLENDAQGWVQNHTGFLMRISNVAREVYAQLAMEDRLFLSVPEAEQMEFVQRVLDAAEVIAGVDLSDDIDDDDDDFDGGDYDDDDDDDSWPSDTDGSE